MQALARCTWSAARSIRSTAALRSAPTESGGLNVAAVNVAAVPELLSVRGETAAAKQASSNGEANSLAAASAAASPSPCTSSSAACSAACAKAVAS